MQLLVDQTIIPLTVGLANDTGTSGSDQISNDGQVSVSGLESGATWEYTTDGGATWNAGTGTSFTLAEGSYGATDVQVRQTDTAGNTSLPASLGSTIIDQTIIPLTVGLANDTGTSGSDQISNDGQVTVSGLESGATWEYTTDGGTTWNVGTGTSFTLAEGSYGASDVQVRQTDMAGNTSTPVSLGVTIIDQTIIPLTVGLANDTGTSGSDQISNDGQVNVSGLESGATWEYTTDGGTTWNAGSGTSFTLAEGSYGANDVQVRQTDTAGNTSASISLGSTIIDQTITPLTVGLANDTGTSGSDQISNDGQVSVSGLESGASWEYTTDGGTTWNAGTGTSFTLAEGSYGASDVQVRQTDTAGNTSASVSLGVTTIDQTIIPLTVGLANDTGTSGSDQISNDGQVTVSGLESGATWEYTTDGGTSWNAGIGTSFTLAEGSYGATDVQVRQTDTAGNTSTPVSLGSTIIDQTIIPLTVGLANDTGTSGSDQISNDGQVNVSGLESGATWEYTTDGGTSWNAGTGTSFTLAEGSYGATDVQVRQTDTAGNTSLPASLGATIIDQTIIPLTVGLANEPEPVAVTKLVMMVRLLFQD